MSFALLLLNVILLNTFDSTSKFCVQLTGALEPAGGFTSITNFASQPHLPASCPPNDFHITFDNNQKLARSSGRIKEGASVLVGICTSVSYIEPGFESNIMRYNSLNPGTWLKQPSVSLLQSVNNQEKHEIKCFSTYQDDFLKENLMKVGSEQQSSYDGSFYDRIDVSLIHEEQGLYVCSECQFMFPSTSDNICPSCLYNPMMYGVGHDPYKMANSFHPPKPAKKLFYCNVCKEIIDASEEGINLHPHPHWTKHFSDILLCPGPGHIEINMARVLLDYLWVPLIEDV